MSKDQNSETVETVETVETPVETEAKVGAPTTTPNDTIAALLPETRIARSAALAIVRGQGIKCSQERMTVIMAGLNGEAPSKEDRDAERAEAKAKKDAEKVEAREAKKAEREAKALEKREAKEKIAAEKLAAKEAAKAAKDEAVSEDPETPSV